MVKVLALLSLAVMIVGCSSSVPQKYRPTEKVTRFSNDDWNTVLQAAVTPDGYVRHEAVKANRDGVKDALLRYCGQIGAASPLNRPELFPSREDKLAYWINAYNALCMYAVQQRNLPSNVLYSGLPGSIFFIDSFSVGEKSMTLNTIESDYVRSFDDPRIHFALNCMSQSCPPLLGEAYEGDRLESQLESQTKRSLSDPRVAKRIDDEKVGLNAIMTDFWKGDFVKYAKEKLNKSDGTPLDAAKALAGPDSPVQEATDYSEISYDWSLNTR